MIAQEPSIAVEPTNTLEQLRAFMKLPLAERRRLLAKQAEQMIEHYEATQEVEERIAWQGGDIVEL